ncbi:MAG: universal stress protein [Betaproteobacteria bacterium]|nr:universal stress protein [Betaproteobacteria bacterium]
MFKHVLIATDGSELSDRALPIALEQAKLNGARVTAASVIDLYPYIGAIEVMPTGIEGWQEAIRAQADAAVQKVADAAKAAGIPCNTAVQEDTLAWRGLLAVAEREHCDLIVMSSHGRGGLTSALLGSQTARVLSHTKIPVLVVR